jgi:hypothetical protein
MWPKTAANASGACENRHCGQKAASSRRDCTEFTLSLSRPVAALAFRRPAIFAHQTPHAQRAFEQIQRLSHVVFRIANQPALERGEIAFEMFVLTLPLREGRKIEA